MTPNTDISILGRDGQYSIFGVSHRGIAFINHRIDNLSDLNTGMTGVFAGDGEAYINLNTTLVRDIADDGIEHGLAVTVNDSLYTVPAHERIV